LVSAFDFSTAEEGLQAASQSFYILGKRIQQFVNGCKGFPSKKTPAGMLPHIPPALFFQEIY